MPQELNREDIIENLRLLSEWLGVKYPAEAFELTVVGGAATPSHAKHTTDIKNLQPARQEISEAVRFVRSIDNSELRKDDLRIVLREAGFDFNEFIPPDGE